MSWGHSSYRLAEVRRQRHFKPGPDRVSSVQYHPVSNPKLSNTEMGKFAHFTTVYQYVPMALEYQFTCF